MEHYGTYCEQTFRTNFNRSRAKCIGWDTSCKLVCSRLVFRYLLSHAPQLEQPLHVILLPQVLQCALKKA